MSRYVAFLRGVSPMNARMPDLKRSFEEAGFADVKTLLSSGNVAFSTREAAESTLEREAEAAMQRCLDRSFPTIVRPANALLALLATDPYADFALPPSAKRVITFLRQLPATKPQLPIEREGAHILAVVEREVFSTYVPNPRGPVFMTLIEKTFGKDVTTRTWETVKKCASA